MSGPSIQLTDVSLQLAGNTILAPLSATLEAGKLHLLVGPNGAGKTSLLKTMLGLMPHRGDVLREWSESKATKPAYIPQQPKFDAVLPVTIMDFMLATMSQRPLFFRQQKQVKQRALALLEKVGLEQKTALQLGQLSGGERQRLMFAQALHRETDLWFLDEPMTGLDGEGQRIITRLILDLRDQGATLVMVHHDMAFVREYADNVLLVDQGLKAQGNAAQVLGSKTEALEVA